MLASVLIACRNGRRHLSETLDALVAQDWEHPWEILFIDNGSTDGSRAIFEAYALDRAGPEMRCIDASERPSKAYALNAGVAAAMADALIICDADDVPAPGYVAAMGEALQIHDLVTARYDLRRLNTGPTGIHRGLPESGMFPLRYPPYVPVAGGATTGFRRALWMKLGGFSEGRQPAEDIDFCARAALAGHVVQPVPGALMHYRLRSDLRSIFRQAYAYSRAEIGLAKAYEGSARPQQEAWAGLAQHSARVARGLAGAAVGRRRHSPLERARVCWDAGTLLGQLAGVLRFRTQPTLGKPANAASPGAQG